MNDNLDMLAGHSGLAERKSEHTKAQALGPRYNVQEHIQHLHDASAQMRDAMREVTRQLNPAHHVFTYNIFAPGAITNGPQVLDTIQRTDNGGAASVLVLLDGPSGTIRFVRVYPAITTGYAPDVNLGILFRNGIYCASVSSYGSLGSSTPAAFVAAGRILVQ